MESQPTPLHTWAIQQMQFRRQGRHVTTVVPSELHLKTLQRGQMVDIWQFVTKHAKSARTVAIVQGNIKLHKMRSLRGHGEHVNQRRQVMVSDIQRTLGAIGHIDRELGRLHQEIAETQTRCVRAQQQIKHLHLTVDMLAAYSRYLAEQQNMMTEYTQQVHHKTCAMSMPATTSASQVQYHRCERHDSPSSPHPAMTADTHHEDLLPHESASTRAVRKTCWELETFLHDLLQGSINSNKQAVKLGKERIWTSVDQVMEQYAAGQLLNSLCIHCQERTNALRDKISQLNLHQDAKALRFKTEHEGHMKDVSCQPSVLHSVHQLLEESQIETVRKFTETEHYHNTASTINHRLNESTALLHNLLHTQLRDLPSDRQLARRLMDTEKDLSVGRASLSVLLQVSSDLHEHMTSAAGEQEALLAKHTTIQDFKKLADSKQSLIRTLVKQNMTTRGCLDSKQKEILAYIRHVVKDHETEIEGRVDELRDKVLLEVEVFVPLTLVCLLLAPSQSGIKEAMADFSIQRLNGATPVAGGDTVRKICELLDFMPYKASELFLPHVKGLLNEAEDLNEDDKFHGAHTRPDHHGLLERVSGVRGEVLLQDRNQLDALLPLLQAHITQASQAMADCIGIRDTAFHWWDQRGQNCSSRTTVDSATLQQWRDRWTVTVTMLRQCNVTN